MIPTKEVYCFGNRKIYYKIRKEEIVFVDKKLVLTLNDILFLLHKIDLNLAFRVNYKIFV